MTRAEGVLWREAREKTKFTQQDIGEKLGMLGAQYVSNVERGKAPMSPKHFKKLAKIFGTRVINEIIEVRAAELKASLRNAL